MTDDERQLAYERQRLADAETKFSQTHDADVRLYYAACIAGWKRSIRVLKKQIEEKTHDQL